MTTTIDFKDYQKEDAFPPDKTASWSDKSRDEDHWVLSHNSLRGELEELEKCLAAQPSMEEPWQLECLQAVWTYHSDHVQKHHESEETVLQPFCAQRFNYPDSIQGGHKELEEKLEKLNNAVMVEDSIDIPAFQEMFASYKTFLLEHLKEEEDVVIPLIHAFFTPEEFKETGKAMGKAGGHAGSFVYYVGEEKFRNETMAKLGIPFFVWYVAFRGAVNEYKQRVIQSVTALQEGKQPPPQEGGWFGGLF